MLQLCTGKMKPHSPASEMPSKCPGPLLVWTLCLSSGNQYRVVPSRSKNYHPSFSGTCLLSLLTWTGFAGDSLDGNRCLVGMEHYHCLGDYCHERTLFPLPGHHETPLSASTKMLERFPNNLPKHRENVIPAESEKKSFEEVSKEISWRAHGCCFRHEGIRLSPGF